MTTPSVLEHSDLSCLYHGEHVELLCLPGNAPYALVTFDIMHARASGRTGFALKLARKNDIPLFAVVPRRPHWYPTDETRHVAKLIKDAKDRPTIGYGASMGAYGVLKHGRALGTDATLAFSPQISINPETTGVHDRRYSRFYDAELNGRMSVVAGDCGPASYLFYDPHFAQDNFQQSLLRDDDVKRVRLGHMGHRAIGTMASSDISKMVFEAVLEGDELTIRAALRMKRAHTADYYHGLATAAMRRGKSELALRIIELGEARKGQTAETKLTRARLLGEIGRPKDGVVLMREMVADHPHQIMYRRFLVDMLERTGALEEAAAVLDTALEQSQNGVLAIRMSKLLHQIDAERAAAFDDIARGRWPDRAQHFAG